MLIQVAQLFAVDLGFFAAEGEADLSRDLHEVLSDPLFDAMDISSAELKEMVAQSPSIARALLALYGAYRDAQHSATTLAVQVSEGEAQEGTEPTPQSPSEEVNDFIQASGNYFPDLEEAAERLWQRAALSENSIQDKLILALHEHHGVKVEIVPWSRLPGALRRYDPKKRQLLLSELLPTRSRRFQLAHQWCLLEHGELLDHHAEDPRFFSAASRSLARVSLANYFAGAVLMPYGPFLDAAKRERYDVDVLGRRYRVGFEQVCHRLTTLRRPKAEGIPFHMLRIDVAGNISKRFSGSGIRFARFGGACPRWNVFQAFMTPGMIRVQVGQMPDGRTFFCIARTIQRDSGGYHAPQPVMAVGLG
ncbi:MAG: DUF2083 domain-containing protein, partial [Myxococcales bacterium]|nr:DUF2083 domain-containing protein [Myxococcales bacterium]